MEAVTIIGAIAAIAIVVGISFVVDAYSWGTYDYRPFNPKTIWVSFVCGLLIAVGVYLWLGAGFTTITLLVLVCGIVVWAWGYVRLLVIVRRESNLLIAIWTATILSALFPVVAPLSAVWFILKPKQSDTTDEDDDDDELEPSGGPRGGPNDLDDLAEERRERREERRKREAEDYANPLTDPNAWNLDDANGDRAELQYRGVDPEDRDPEDC